ncbi:extracellular exo-alpha-L-arabinofuranosidase [Abditibacteriota bacterium]|nr:extracellular exo-alpha-L-arabinofuranosidase [Abditibacteriota bacterium]
MQKVALSLLTVGGSFLFTLGGHAQPLSISSGIQNFPSLPNKTITLTGHSELHISGTDKPLAGSVINLDSPDAWLFLDNVRPSVVLTDVLTKVRVSGAAAVNGVNVRVAEYAMGSVIIPQPSDYSPMQVWNKPSFGGKSMQLSSYTFWDSSSLGKMNKAVASFKLKRGYMATVAQQPDGTGRSRVYIAQDGDITVGALPPKFKNSIQFIRVFPWQWTGKKGWCGGDPEYQVDPLWWYNWGPTSVSMSNIEFVPMKWDDKGTSYLNINNKQGSTHLLAFNEPNGADQANMTTDQAIAEWPKLMQSGLRLGSPAPTDGGAGWLDDFIHKADAKGYRVDYVAVHFYRCGQSANQLYNYLKGVHDRTGRPVWVTEYNNGANWTQCPDPTFEQNARVMGEWSDMMERTPWIERYSVYNWVEDVRAMTLGATITPAGKVYRDHASGIAYQQELPSGADADARYNFSGDASDITSSGNDGMLVGAPTFVSGKAGGKAIQLDGQRDYVQLPSSVGSSADFSFAGWINWKGGDANQRIFDLGDGTDRYLFLTPSSSDKTLRFAITTGSYGAEQRLDSKALVPGTWTHVAVTIKNNVGKLYVNGTVVATNANMTLSPDKVKTKYNYLGKSQFPDPLFAGQLQEVSFAGQALTDAEVSDLTQTPLVRLPAFLSPVPPEPIKGMVGVGTWGTQAEFKDIKVTQGNKTLYASDFSNAKGLDGWKTSGGKWEIVDGALRQSSDASNVRALFGDATWNNYTLTLKARKISGGEGFLIIFGSPGDDTKSWWNLGGWGNTKNAIQTPDLDSPQVPGTIETGRWYDIKIELQGPTVKAYLDGKLVQQATQ